ncbi:DUF58 domain-containing protein [Actinotalea sp. AC32]|nr:DUF58 domain-containing protein [Actinotalea sp. AC32]
MATRATRLTSRGLGLLGGGAGLLVLGVLAGVTALVQVGALLLLTVGVSTALLVLTARHHARGGLSLTRRILPHPVEEGSAATVEVELLATRSGRTAPRVDRLTIAERASRELSDGGPLRARVRRSRDRLRLDYPITPVRRGRWPVGPVQLSREDLFGVAHWSGPVGEPALVAVRPAISRLALSSSALASDVDRAALGARSPAADDTSLRDYRSGDDLRRVHWRSSARRGQLVVRQDERSGRRPATVVLDLPQHGPTGEWSIRVAASVAVGLAEAGHHVRLLGGDVLGVVPDHHRAGTGTAAAESLLDQTVDLSMPHSPGQRLSWLATAVDTLHADGGGAELVFAVVGELEPGVLASLARTGEVTHGWAMVRTSETGEAVASPDAQRTAERLRRAGWTVCLVRPGEDVATCWQRLLTADDRVVAAR